MGLGDRKEAQMTKTVAVLPGDGIGREVIPAAVSVLEALALDLRFEWFDADADRFLRDGQALPEQTFAQVAAADAILLGAIGDPRVRDPGYTRQVLIRIRADLDLYANLRPVRLWDERHSPLRDPARRRLDVLVVRENTEGLYSGLGARFRVGPGGEVAIQHHLNSRHAITRVLEHAFRVARREVCMADKWNAMPHAGPLWQECWREVSARHPEVAARHLMIDACALHLVREPQSFDVIVTENCFGDVLSDLAAELAGGLGLAPSANVNPETGRGMFEPVHGSAPDIAGRGLANPLAGILSAALMLRHLRWPDAAAAVESAVGAALRAQECTPDVGGSLSTREATAAVIRRLPG
jgi:3-isopropylmalate dehydrogenase